MKEKEFKERLINFMRISKSRLKDGKVITCYEEMQEVQGMLNDELSKDAPVVATNFINMADTHLKIAISKLREGKFFDAYDEMGEVIKLCS